MIVDAQLQVAGSVSGGCIEGAVIEAVQQVLQDGCPQRLDYGVEDETAWSEAFRAAARWPCWWNPIGPAPGTSPPTLCGAP